MTTTTKKRAKRDPYARLRKSFAEYEDGLSLAMKLGEDAGRAWALKSADYADVERIVRESTGAGSYRIDVIGLGIVYEDHSVVRWLTSDDCWCIGFVQSVRYVDYELRGFTL